MYTEIPFEADSKLNPIQLKLIPFLKQLNSYVYRGAERGLVWRNLDGAVYNSQILKTCVWQVRGDWGTNKGGWQNLGYMINCTHQFRFDDKGWKLIIKWEEPHHFVGGIYAKFVFKEKLNACSSKGIRGRYITRHAATYTTYVFYNWISYILVLFSGHLFAWITTP